jgi:catechol 2,3-dioxygenase
MATLQAPRLPETTHLGQVCLNVAALEPMLRFYTQVIGLDLLSQDAGRASLGAGGRELLRLVLKPGARRHARRAGLYHFCLLVPQRAELGRLLQRLLAHGVELQGLVDHRMAEAIYLADPEGNGLELNWDKPRAVWEGRLEALISLGNLPLDTDGLLAEAEAAGPGDGRLPQGASLGHVHLHVADLPASRAFYHGVLGFDITGEYPGQAVFSSAGGYHHHVAFNIWHGRGAPEPPPDASGLRWFSVQLPDAASLAGLAERVRRAGVPVEATAEGLLLRDPSGNGVLLRA